MKPKLTTKDITPAIKSSVNAYLMARVYAETMREKVDEVYREILQIYPIYTDAFSRANTEKRRITENRDMYLSRDEEACTDIYTEADRKLRDINLTPDDMPAGHCPALVAEDIQRKTEALIIDNAAVMLRFEGGGKELHHRLLCSGMDKYREFINLIVGLVVNLPGFKNPLTGRA